MAEKANITRRSIIKALPFLGAAAAIPSVAVVTASETETLLDRLERLTNELSEAMSEYMGGHFKAIVEPGPHGDVHFEPLKVAASRRRDLHLAGYKRACEELDPLIRDWTDLGVTDGCGGGTVSFRASGRYEGDGTYESGHENVFGRRGRWDVTLNRGELIDGYRAFTVECPGERMVLTEPRLETFIGRKIA